MLRLWIDERGIRDLLDIHRKLRQAMGDLRDRTRPHRESRTYMKDRWSVNFDSQGSIYGAWKAWSPKTVELHGTGGTILNRTGRLRSGFMAQASAGKVSTDATMWEFRKNPRYLFAQHFGNPNNSSFAKEHGFGPVPARKIWDLNGEDEAHITKIFDDFTQEIMDRYF